MKYKLFLIIFSTYYFGFSQNVKVDYFKLDSLYHDDKVSNYISKLKIKSIDNILQITKYNFESNETYLFWLEEESVKVVLLVNRKLKKRMKISRNKKLEQCQQNYVRDFLNSQNISFFADSSPPCEESTLHSYPIKINYRNQTSIIQSNCLHNFRELERLIR